MATTASDIRAVFMGRPYARPVGRALAERQDRNL
jgi:hypothetical protein